MPYVGSKRKHVKRILDMIPCNVKVCSPFLGSGHVEHAIAERGQQIFVYDAWEELVLLWRAMLNPKTNQIVRSRFLQYLPVDKKSFYDLREHLEMNQGAIDDLTRAAMFFALNRTSFNNNCRSFGSKSTAGTRRGLDKLLERMEKFHTRLNPQLMTFQESLRRHPDCLWFLDPPYYVERGHYGYKGELHHNFDHQALQQLVRNHRGPWILTYNDCPEVREMYAGCRIEPLSDQVRYRDSRTRGTGHILITNIG